MPWRLHGFCLFVFLFRCDIYNRNQHPELSAFFANLQWVMKHDEAWISMIYNIWWSFHKASNGGGPCASRPGQDAVHQPLVD